MGRQLGAPAQVSEGAAVEKEIETLKTQLASTQGQLTDAVRRISDTDTRQRIQENEQVPEISDTQRRGRIVWLLDPPLIDTISGTGAAPNGDGFSTAETLNLFQYLSTAALDVLLEIEFIGGTSDENGMRVKWTASEVSNWTYEEAAYAYMALGQFDNSLTKRQVWWPLNAGKTGTISYNRSAGDYEYKVRLLAYCE